MGINLQYTASDLRYQPTPGSHQGAYLKASHKVLPFPVVHASEFNGFLTDWVSALEMNWHNSQGRHQGVNKTQNYRRQ